MCSEHCKSPKELVSHHRGSAGAGAPGKIASVWGKIQVIFHVFFFLVISTKVFSRDAKLSTFMT